MARIGFVGIRGMVGSCLLQRMVFENDFDKRHEYSFFSTSQVGTPCPPPLDKEYFFLDSNNCELLQKMDIIVTMQGSNFTKQNYFSLRKNGWNGYWLDSSSCLRMDDEAIIVLDPVNKLVIDKAISSGKKTFVGGNCTVSLLLMATHGLIKENLVEWISTMTYQAISGAGAAQVEELIKQVNVFNFNTDKTPLDMKHEPDNLPKDFIGYPLAYNLLPWIDKATSNGRTLEEWKGNVEFNKIINSDKQIPVDGICVRVPTFRSHAQALTIKLNKNLSIKEIEKIISQGNEWVKVITNNKDDTLNNLTPLKVSGSLDIAVGRVKKLLMGEEYLSLFTIGDQLLWGASEPLRRILNIILQSL